MEYSEVQMLHQSIKDFILKFKTKKQVEVQYYFSKGRINEYDFSFFGYYTKYGAHGIHYCKQRNIYFFGINNLYMESTLKFIPLGITASIPSRLKDALLKVSETKVRCVIPR